MPPRRFEQTTDPESHVMVGQLRSRSRRTCLPVGVMRGLQKPTPSRTRRPTLPGAAAPIGAIIVRIVRSIRADAVSARQRRYRCSVAPLLKTIDEQELGGSGGASRGTKREKRGRENLSDGCGRFCPCFSPPPLLLDCPPRGGRTDSERAPSKRLIGRH